MLNLNLFALRSAFSLRSRLNSSASPLASKQFCSCFISKKLSSMSFLNLAFSSFNRCKLKETMHTNE